MFQLDQTYATREHVLGVPRRFRLVAADVKDGVALVELSEHHVSRPVMIKYDHWVHLYSTVIEPFTDPYFGKNWAPESLPKGAARRLAELDEVLETESIDNSILLHPKALSAFITRIAQKTKVSRPTARIWIYLWLRAGKDTKAIVAKFCEPKPKLQQQSGARRGRPRGECPTSSDVASYEVEKEIRNGLEKHYFKAKLTLSDAYFESLISEFNVPRQLATKAAVQQFFCDAKLLAKYRVPSIHQFRYLKDKMVAARKPPHGSKAPRGKRGRAAQGVFGPGHWEIDATILQVQLVSRITKKRLVGRAILYLVIDVFDDTIVGYAITLESFCWSVAALAIHNAVADKKATLERLDLPLSADDWCGGGLPYTLTGDRAELITDKGSELPRSQLNVYVTPSMCPIAKGGIEGTNSEVKGELRYIDLSGLYEKFRQRRVPDGKDDAALDLETIEACVVETIYDLNHKPLPSHRIPAEALAAGPSVLTRIGLHKWGLEHRGGHMRRVPAFFAQEHLLTRDTATMTTQGLLLDGQVYRADRIDELGWVGRVCVGETIEARVSYYPLDASEIYFRDPGTGQWHRARNIDPAVTQYRWSFYELKSLRSQRTQLRTQAGFMQHSAHMESLERRKDRNAQAKKQTKHELDGQKRDKRETSIRANRDLERRINRQHALDEIHTHTAHAPAPPAQPPAPAPTPTPPLKPTRRGAVKASVAAPSQATSASSDSSDELLTDEMWNTAPVHSSWDGSP